MSRRVINTKSNKVATFLIESTLPDQNPPTYTARGGPFTLTATPTAVPGASVTTAAFSAAQKAIITCSVELDIPTLADVTEVTMSIFDGIAAVAIDTFRQTVGVGAGEGAGTETVSWTLEVVGNGAARTFGLAVSDPATLTTIPANGCRTVVQIVNG